MWKILIIEENEEKRQILMDILGERAKCDIADNKVNALTQYEQSSASNEPYHMVLLGLTNPESEGLEFLKSVRQKEEAQHIPVGSGVPVIVFTDHRELFLDAFNRGCDDYVLLPVDPEKFIKKVEEKLAGN